MVMPEKILFEIRVDSDWRVQNMKKSDFLKSVCVCVCAVSYTHLDVYKRQTQDLLFLVKIGWGEGVVYLQRFFIKRIFYGKR